MKIHGMCLVKNEDDVIEETLRAASSWCDHIHVVDTGSSDNTLNIVRRLHKEPSNKISSVEVADVGLFSDGLRSLIYNKYSSMAQPGDWWARIDADEIYVDDPRSFLKAVDIQYSSVWYASLSYYFSSAAAEEYEKYPERYADSVPVGDRCRYYFNHWSELRFVRHEAMGIWPDGEARGWPKSAEEANACPARILCRHYCYRSPTQIEKRIATRKAAALSGTVFAHEAIKNWSQVVDPEAVKAHKWKDIAYTTQEREFEEGWRSRIIPASSLNYDNHDGQYVVNDNLMPQIPSVRYRSIADDSRALAKRILLSIGRKLGRRP